MFTPIAKFIDWYALQFIWAIRLRSLRRWKIDEQNSGLAETCQFLNGPDFIPAESQPAPVEFSSHHNKPQFSFPTPRPCEFVENNIVPGRLYRCSGQWQKFPTIILLHGGGDFLNHRLRFPRTAGACRRAGFNAVTVVAPYHFQRRPRELGQWNYLRTAQAFAQGVAEIRALTGWLLEQGCPAVALWGISLGGWLAGLAATRDARFAAVVMAVPGIRMKYKFSSGKCVIWNRVRQMLEAQRPAIEILNQTPLNLILSRPAIPGDDILLIEATHDLFVEPAATEELWQSWERPEIWRLPHGHISWMGAPGITDRVLRWLKPRLKPMTAA